MAHANARKDKHFYKEVIMVDSNPEFYLNQIQDMLMNGTYHVGPEDYTVSTICDKGKKRELWKLPYFPHRIIQWAIMLQIEPIFHEVLTDFTCASLAGRGIHAAMRKVDHYMEDRPGTQYCLKMDIHHFYPSIDHATLKKMLRRKFKDQKLLAVLDMIIDSHPPKGIPIGSYLSQYLANFYLAYFDHWLKEEMGVKYVVRYMDDVVIFHHSKEFLHWLRIKISEYLEGLKLELKSNWQVFPTAIRGVDFVGYRFFFGFKLLRKKSCKRFKRVCLEIRDKWENGNRISYRQWCAANSYRGWLRWCNSYRLCQKYLAPIQNTLDDFYTNVILAKSKRRKAAVAVC